MMPSRPLHHISFCLLSYISLLFLSSTNLHAEPPLDIQHIPVCMDFGCKHKQMVALSTSDWNSVANWLRPGAPDAKTERKHIVNAIGWMERVIGEHTPTHRDLGGDLSKDAKFPGQLDCIDESLNTTIYLTLFEQHNLLKHHKVIDRAYRRTLLDQHWAGQIETLAKQERWVIDSWFQHNGYLPYLQRTEKWQDIPFFTSYLDSSQPEKTDNKKPTFLNRWFN